MLFFCCLGKKHCELTDVDHSRDFKCPMDGCDATMGSHNLKTGEGVKHMIQNHQIYPYKMVKMGLTWSRA